MSTVAGGTGEHRDAAARLLVERAIRALAARTGTSLVSSTGVSLAAKLAEALVDSRGPGAAQYMADAIDDQCPGVAIEPHGHMYYDNGD